MNFLKSLFELNLYRKSFKVPLMKIIGSALVLLIVSVFRLSVTITNLPLNLFVSFICIALVIMAILCLFIAAVEALQVSQNKKNMRDKK